MKRKIGELRNIPIVEGDKNLVREGTEIHINDLQSSSSSGGGSKMEYYKLNKEKYGDEHDSPLHILFRISVLYPSIMKVNDENSNIYACVPFFAAIMSPEAKLHDIISIWEGIAFDSNIKTYAHIPEEAEYNCDNLSELISLMETKLGISWKDDALIPITEEEFYKLD